MATQLLDHTTRALDAAPDRAEIHAVHALALTLASPDDLAEARAAMQRAAELAPDDAFYEAGRAFLQDAQQAPGTPPSPPDGPEPMLPGPSPEFFAEGYLLGSGDRGRHVKALHQRLACLRVPGFNDPGRYFDEYHEPTRQAVVQFQADRGLTPTGVVGAVTWNAIEEAAAASPDCNVQALALPPNAHYVLAGDAPVDDALADNQPADEEAADDQLADIASRPSYGAAGQPVVYLTFDDGPHAAYTLPMLEILSRFNAVGTFFVLGVQVQRFPEALEQVVAGGHQVASHTVNHPSLANLTREEFIGEVVGGGRGDPGSRRRPRRPAPLLASTLRRRRCAHGSTCRRAGESDRDVGCRPAGLAAAGRGANRFLRPVPRLSRSDHPHARRRRRPQPDRRRARNSPRRAFLAWVRVSEHPGVWRRSCQPRSHDRAERWRTCQRRRHSRAERMS